MAHKREIKPQFFRNEELADLSRDHRLVFIGLWTIADKQGVLEDRPRRIHADLFPYDPDLGLEKVLHDLTQAGFLRRYGSNVKCIEIVNFTKHQRPHPKENDSGLPTYAEFSAESARETGKGQPKVNPGSTQGELEVNLGVVVPGLLSEPSVSSKPSEPSVSSHSPGRESELAALAERLVSHPWLARGLVDPTATALRLIGSFPDCDLLACVASAVTYLERGGKPKTDPERFIHNWCFNRQSGRASPAAASLTAGEKSIAASHEAMRRAEERERRMAAGGES